MGGELQPHMGPKRQEVAIFVHHPITFYILQNYFSREKRYFTNMLMDVDDED